MYIDLHTHHNTPHLDVVQLINSFDQDPLDNRYSYGIHPWYADRPFDLEHLQEMTYSPRCLSIGEIGIDKIKGPSLEIQKNVFLLQAELAKNLAKPCIIHCVKAHQELMQIKKKDFLNELWVIHGFRKTAVFSSMSALGFKFSLGAALLYDENLRTLFAAEDLDHFYFETDDASVDIRALYQEAALLKKIDVNLIVQKVFTNYTKDFLNQTTNE